MLRLNLPAAALMVAGVTSVATAAPGDATYTVTFDATWSAETHPQNFPSTAHFSGLVGGTHDATIHFWAPGEPASLGIQRMAEWGLQSVLADEVQVAIDGGSAGAVLLGPVLSVSPGTVAMTFTATAAHSLVTLTTMVAPSPDWFVGVAGLDLRSGGDWAQEVVVELYPWDAGTDSGVNYTSGDQPTVPHVPVFAIAGAPFSPGVPLGTFTFHLEGVAETPPAARPLVTVFPNPFNPRTTIRYDLPQAGTVELGIFDPRGRRVRTLLAGAMSAGAHEVAWDGCDARGRASASGTYILRLVTADGVQARAVTLAR